MGLGIELCEFFFRAIANLARRIGTSDWPVLTAIVSKSETRETFWGCIVIAVHYKYRNADRRFEGTHKQPFIFKNYAEAYLRRFPGGSEFSVRIDPKHPSFSIPANWKVTRQELL